MLRQALAVPSRALRSSARSVSRRPLPRAQTFLAPIAVPRRKPAAARWYSDTPRDSPEAEKPEAEKPEAEKPEAEMTEAEMTEALAEAAPAPEAAEPAEDPVVVELRTMLEAKDKEAAEWKDKCLRAVADFRNLQERTVREVKNAREFAIQNFAKDLVDSVDNLDRALSQVPTPKLAAKDKSEDKSEDLQDLLNLFEGLKMTDNIMQSTLKKHGLERFDPVDDKFNPNEHEAVTQLPQPGKPDGTIFFVQQKGFKLNGRVLRAAKVGVVKNPPAAAA